MKKDWEGEIMHLDLTKIADCVKWKALWIEARAIVETIATNTIVFSVSECNYMKADLQANYKNHAGEHRARTGVRVRTERTGLARWNNCIYGAFEDWINQRRKRITRPASRYLRGETIVKPVELRVKDIVNGCLDEIGLPILRTKTVLW